MPDESVLEELCRRGDLSLVRSPTTGRVGLARGGYAMLGALDREEWLWLQHCAVPLALQVLGPESDERVPVGGQATLPVDAG